ncbi:MAG TPA: hypothetical protein VHL59_16695 [Thermoanaerobaculia bacterium]|nr:hypothetical protein [Thermoanaerobaculia bacterium]
MNVRRWVFPGAAVMLVLGAYAFYGSVGTFDFPRVSWDRTYTKPGEGYYSSLAEGFRRGRLSMAHEADPKLISLHDPYDPNVRHFYGAPYLWDASYFDGKYYLYFTPLPALLFYLPFRLLRGAYPPDGLAAAFFGTWAFVMCVAAAWRALAGRRLHVPFSLWVLMIGLGNVVPLTLIYVRVYELAILCGMAMSATWGYALVRFLESGSARRAVWMGFWLAMAIAARPNLAVLLLPTLLVLPWRKWRVLVGCAVPLAIVGAMVMSYNYARFRSITEFGVTYQLTFAPMRDHRVCSLCDAPEAFRFFNNTMHYVWWAPPIRSDFPYVGVSYNALDPSVTFPGGVVEPMLGVGPVNPLTLIAALLAVLMLFHRRPRDHATRSGLWLLAASWLVLFGLATCWYIVARYALDFELLMIVATVILIEAGITFLDEAGVMVWPLRIGAIVVALYSILLGVFLGFTGPQSAFEKTNPERYKTLYEALSVKKKP